MIEQAKDEIQREKEQALVQLRTEVADLAILVAGKVLDAESRCGETPDAGGHHDQEPQQGGDS